MRNVSNFVRVELKLKSDIDAHLVNRQKGELDSEEEFIVRCRFEDYVCGVYHFGLITKREYVKLINLVSDAFPFPGESS